MKFKKGIMADKRVRMQQKDRLPTWATIIITIIVTLIVVLLLWEVVKNDSKDKWTRDLTTDVKKMETDFSDDFERHDTSKSQTMTMSKDLTATDTTATTELKNWFQKRTAFDCVITDMNTGNQMLYEANDDFTKVRFEDAEGGFIVDRDWTYTWDDQTMTGMRLKTNLDDVETNLVVALPTLDSATDDYEVDCYAPGQVDVRRPSGINFDETVKVSN